MFCGLPCGLLASANFVLIACFMLVCLLNGSLRFDLAVVGAYCLLFLYYVDLFG